jgi:hypothetical protein
MKRGWIAAFVLVVSLAQAALAKKAADPLETQAAWRALFAASEDPIKPGSSCDGAYGQEGPPRVGDLLAMRLSFLYHGKNSIVGKCRGQTCSLSIRHAYDEDVSSTDIRFQVRDSKALAETLECVMSP